MVTKSLKQLLVLGALGACGTLAALPAHAGVGVSIGINAPIAPGVRVGVVAGNGGYGYYHRPRVYAPAPVVYAPPVYYRPAPVVYVPPPVVVRPVVRAPRYVYGPPVGFRATVRL